MGILRILRTSFWPGTAFASTAVASLTLNVASKLVVLVTSILLARWLGATDFGIYVSSIAILLLMSVPAQLGFPALVVRLTSAYEAQNEWPLLHGLMRSSTITVARSALLVSLTGVLILWLCSVLLPEVHGRTLLWAMAILPVAALLTLVAATLRGFHRVLTGQLTESVIVPSLFLLLVVVWQLFAVQYRFQLTADVAMAIRLTATLIALLTAAWCLSRVLPSEITRVMPEYDRKMWIHAALPLALLGALNIVNAQTDVLMLAAIRGADSAGIYQAAVRGSELVALSLFIVGGVARPTISRLYARGDLKELQRLVTTSVRAAFAVSVPIAIILATFSKPILRIVYGSEFEQGGVALSFLCAAQVVNVGTGLVGQILVMTGHERDAAFGLGIGVGVNVILNAALIPLWGIAGAAVATGVSLVVWNVFLMRRVRRRTRLNSGILPMPA